MILSIGSYLPKKEAQKREKRDGLRPQTDAPVDDRGEHEGCHREGSHVARRLRQEVSRDAVGARRSLANHHAPFGREHSHARLLQHEPAPEVSIKTYTPRLEMGGKGGNGRVVDVAVCASDQPTPVDILQGTWVFLHTATPDGS